MASTPRKKKNQPQAPWRNLAQAAAKVGRGRRFLLDEIKKGNLRAARIGAHQEVLTCDAWLDEWVENKATVVPLPQRRRTG